MKSFIKTSLAVIASGVAITILAGDFSHDYYKVREHIQCYRENKNKTTLFFIQQAKEAQFEPLQTKSNCYQLVLRNPDLSVLYFSDAPRRDAGRLSLHEFLQTWKHSHVVPNTAVLGYINAKDHRKSQEVREVTVLSDPIYQPKLKQLVFTACPLPKQDQTYPMQKLQNVTLFIDNFAPWPP